MHVRSNTLIVLISLLLVVLISLTVIKLDIVSGRSASAVELRPTVPLPPREQEKEDEEEDQDEGERPEREVLERTIISLEKKLDDVEERLLKADDAGDDALVERLEEAAEEIEQRLEQLERRMRRDEDTDEDDGEYEEEEDEDEEDDEEEEEDEEEDWDGDRDEEEEAFEHHERELELRLRELQVENMQLELKLRRFDMTERMVGAVGNREAAAAYAIVHFEEYVEPEDAIETLSEVLEHVDSPVMRRLVHLRLANLYREADRPRAAKRHIMALILGDERPEESR